MFRRIVSFNYWNSAIVLARSYTQRQYKNSVLGFCWGLIPPCIQIIVMSYIFSSLLNQPQNYMVLSLAVGIPLWSFLCVSLGGITNSLVSNGYILKKCTISRTIFPIADFMVQLYNMFFTLFVMYITAILLLSSVLNYSIIYLPVVLIPFIIFVFGLSIAFTFLTPYIRDIPQLVQTLLNVFYWSVPIVYPYSMIPESKRFLFEINPLFIVIRPIQVLMIDGNFPSFILVCKSYLIASISIIIAFIVYRVFSKNVIFYL